MYLFLSRLIWFLQQLNQLLSCLVAALVMYIICELADILHMYFCYMDHIDNYICGLFCMNNIYGIYYMAIFYLFGESTYYTQLLIY